MIVARPSNLQLYFHFHHHHDSAILPELIGVMASFFNISDSDPPITPEQELNPILCQKFKSFFLLDFQKFGGPGTYTGILENTIEKDH